MIEPVATPCAPALQEGMDTVPANPPLRFVRYANRKVYDAQAHNYITHEQLLDIMRRGQRFEVTNTHGDECYTADVLSRILVRLSRSQQRPQVKALETVILNALQEPQP